jgi:hypothetical protein
MPIRNGSHLNGWDFKTIGTYQNLSNQEGKKMHIYLDESGDLGFHSRSSNHIVIALLITKNPLSIERCIKRIRQRKLKKQLKELPEIKFNKSGDSIREKTLKCIVKEPVEIAYIVLNKSRVDPSKQYHKQKIYNFITGYLINCLPFENGICS